MVSMWRWRRRQAANLWLYLVLSLLFHGAAVLALHWADPPLELTKTEEPPPIEIVDAPKAELDDTPPPDTPNRAARNTVAQGTVRPDSPRNLETTQRATASSDSQTTPQAESSPEPLPSPVAQTQPQPAPNPVAQAESQPQPSPEPIPSPVAQAEPQPQPSPVASPEPQPKPQPQPSPIVQATPEPTPSPIVPPKPQPQPLARLLPPIPQPAPPAVSRPNPQPPTNPTPPQVAAAPTPPKGNASLLGGTLSKDARQAQLDQEANTTRNAPGPTQLAARQEVDLGPYLANLRRRVQERWNPHTPDQQRQAVIGFTINRDGQISNMRVLQTSGNAQTDTETILAIQRAAPFGALPEQYPHNKLEIEFTFNIYVNNSVIQTPRSWYGF
ncbi:energy transducer TonB [Synechococcus sp. C9]|uniref:energy transducer TonB n=1 Tax=Synechococcus sp. C9 TaxID=102119 RepID=UPI001FF3DF5E|nr:energy transducer TonB [Synechococcus sp. C9]